MSRETGNKLNLERLAGVARFIPAGESGAIRLGDVLMHKQSHEREVKQGALHSRAGTTVVVREDVTKADLSWTIELQEHTKESDAILFGEVGDPEVQALGEAIALAISDVAKRREYSLGKVMVSNVEVKVGVVDKKVGKQDAKGGIAPADADVIVDEDLGTIYVRDGGTIVSGDDLAVTFDCAAVTRDTILPLANPQRTGTLVLSEFDGSSAEPKRIVSFECTLSPDNWGENQVDGDPNKFSLKATATSVPKVISARAKTNRKHWEK